MSGGRFRPEATVFASAQRLDTRTSGASHPATHWPDGVEGSAGRPGLPAAGGAVGAFSSHLPGRSPGDYLRVGRPVPASSRRVDTAPISDGGPHRGDELDPVVVPSRLGSVGVGEAPPGGPGQPAPPRSVPDGGPQPRRVEPEMVAGKPVFVVYRPSRGFEVRDESRDTDRVVR